MKIEERDASPLTRHALLHLRLFSAGVFVFAALLMQFLLTFHTALLLKLNSFSFQYSLFTINYQSESSYSPVSLNDLSESVSKWSEDQIYFIYASGPLILSVIGLRLLFSLKKNLMAGWKTKLVLTWLAFVMVNALPCGIIAGVLSYDGFGVAFHWMVGNYIIRMLIAMGVLLVLIIFSRFWQWLFLNTCYNTAFLGNEVNQRKFLKNVFFIPWMLGLIILVLFNWPFNSLYWPVFLLSLGAIPAFNKSLRYQAVVIAKSENRIFTRRYQPLLIALALVLLWAAGTIRIDF